MAARKLFGAEARGCAVTLASGSGGIVLVLSSEPAFTAIFARRWKHACRALVRASDPQTGRTVQQQGEHLAVLHCPPNDASSMALAKRLAAGLFAPISVDRARGILGLSAAELAAQTISPSLPLRGERHGRGYTYWAYSPDDILGLADELRAQVAR
jgi:hypothetical protein